MTKNCPAESVPTIESTCPTCGHSVRIWEPAYPTRGSKAWRMLMLYRNHARSPEGSFGLTAKESELVANEVNGYRRVSDLVRLGLLVGITYKGHQVRRSFSPAATRLNPKRREVVALKVADVLHISPHGQEYLTAMLLDDKLRLNRAS